MPHFNGPTTLNLGDAFVKMITELKMNHQSNCGDSFLFM